MTLSLPVANLLGVIGVHFVERPLNAFVGNSGDVRRISETPLAVENDVNKPIGDFAFRRNVKQFAQMFHDVFPLNDLRGQDATPCKTLQYVVSLKVPSAPIFATNGA